jgi:HK97 family phage prohead protease
MTNPVDTRDMSDGALLRITPPLEIKLAGDGADQGTISGYASVFAGQPGGEPDAYGDLMQRGCYAATLAEHRAAGTMPAMLWSHAMPEVVGKWVQAQETDRGLFVEGKLNLNTTRGREAFEHLKAKDVNGLSIGFRIRQGGATIQDDGTRLVTAVDLLEVSIVALPAAKLARVNAVRSIETRQELIDALRSTGLPLNAAKAVAARGWAGLGTADDDAAAAELARRIDAARHELKSFR